MSAGVPPLGVVTFLFTDIEGSTRRWEADADAMRAALLAHDEVLRTAIEAHDGFFFSHTGDGVVAAFASPKAAPLDPDEGCPWPWTPLENRGGVKAGQPPDTAPPEAERPPMGPTTSQWHQFR